MVAAMNFNVQFLINVLGIRLDDPHFDALVTHAALKLGKLVRK